DRGEVGEAVVVEVADDDVLGQEASRQAQLRRKGPRAGAEQDGDIAAEVRAAVLEVLHRVGGNEIDEVAVVDLAVAVIVVELGRDECLWRLAHGERRRGGGEKAVSGPAQQNDRACRATIGQKAGEIDRYRKVEEIAAVDLAVAIVVVQLHGGEGSGE